MTNDGWIYEMYEPLMVCTSECYGWNLQIHNIQLDLLNLNSEIWGEQWNFESVST